jgi:hypothetical protein
MKKEWLILSGTFVLIFSVLIFVQHFRSKEARQNLNLASFMNELTSGQLKADIIIDIIDVDNIKLSYSIGDKDLYKMVNLQQLDAFLKEYSGSKKSISINVSGQLTMPGKEEDFKMIQMVLFNNGVVDFLNNYKVELSTAPFVIEFYGVSKIKIVKPYNVKDLLMLDDFNNYLKSYSGPKDRAVIFVSNEWFLQTQQEVKYEMMEKINEVFTSNGFKSVVSHIDAKDHQLSKEE